MNNNSAIQTTLDMLVAERDELNLTINLLAKRLGVPVPPGGGGTPVPGDYGGSGGGGDPIAGTHEGEYHGFTSTKASHDVLKKFGSRQHPLKTKDIYDAIKKGGVDIGTEDALYRSLARSRHFRKVARGTWGLSDWYPEGDHLLNRADGATALITRSDPEGVLG